MELDLLQPSVVPVLSEDLSTMLLIALGLIGADFQVRDTSGIVVTSCAVLLR
jgi:hypothetical protein